MGNICGCHNRVTDLDIKKNTIFTKKEFDITLYDPEILGNGIDIVDMKKEISDDRFLFSKCDLRESDEV